MTPAEVPDALAHALAEALNRYETSGLCPLRGACGLCDCGADMQTPERQEEDYRRALDRARYGLAAVLTEIKRQSHRAGYEMARDDMVSGGFIGGPTYEALRDSFTGRQIVKEALNDAANDWQRGEWANAPRRANQVQERIANGQYVGDWLRDRAARLGATTEEGGQ